jgi:hypothetical protein
MSIVVSSYRYTQTYVYALIHTMVTMNTEASESLMYPAAVTPNRAVGGAVLVISDGRVDGKCVSVDIVH